MKRFLKAVALLLAPVVLFFSFCFIALVKSRELQILDEAISLSSSPDILYGLAYRNDIEVYKQALTTKRAAKLLVLGTSRTMQLGQELFTQNSFYNAGGATPRIDHFLHFLKSLPQNALPEKMIIGLDQNFFNQTWDDHSILPSYDRAIISSISFLQRFVQDIARGRVDFGKIFKADKYTLGLAAIVNNSGFAHDGSYEYGTVATDPAKNPDFDFSGTLHSVSVGVERFAYGADVCNICTERMAELIAYCSDNGIELVGIMPPYAPTVWQAMESSGNYTYIDKIYTSLLPLFDQNGFELYNYSDFALSSDDEYIDGYHGSDKTYARIMLDIASKTSILKNDISPNIPSLLKSNNHMELAKS